jgi:hypothetical protein
LGSGMRPKLITVAACRFAYHQRTLATEPGSFCVSASVITAQSADIHFEAMKMRTPTRSPTSDRNTDVREPDAGNLHVRFVRAELIPHRRSRTRLRRSSSFSRAMSSAVTSNIIGESSSLPNQSGDTAIWGNASNFSVVVNDPFPYSPPSAPRPGLPLIPSPYLILGGKLVQLGQYLVPVRGLQGSNRISGFSDIPLKRWVSWRGRCRHAAHAR